MRSAPAEGEPHAVRRLLAANPPGHAFCWQCAATHHFEPRFALSRACTLKHLADRILTPKSALEDERKQVTVVSADLKGSARGRLHAGAWPFGRVKMNVEPFPTSLVTPEHFLEVHGH